MISLIVPIGIVLVTLIWLHYRKKHNYFKDHGIPYSPGYLPFGSRIIWKVLRGQQNIFQVAEDLYDDFPGAKAFGYYRPFGKPVLVIKDLELAKRMMVKDFEYFTDRSFMEIHPETNKYLQGLAILKGEEWRSERQLMTPLFTAQKLKTMLPWMHKMGDEFTKYLENHKGDIDCKESFGKFTMELLGSLGVGVKPNVISEEENLFYDQGLRLTGGRLPSIATILRIMFFTCFPKIAYALKLKFWDQDNLDFFVNAVNSSVESRKDKVIQGNESFLDAMLKTGIDKEFKFESKDHAKTFIITNAIMLFFVGQDTMSGAMSITSYYLMKYPDVQDKVFNEIKAAVDDNNGDENLDYATLNNLTFLEKVMKESMRLWCVNFFDRACTKDYFIPELNFTVPKGMHVTIAAGKLMNDEKNVPDAMTFDPEGHFGNDSSLSGSNYLTFGQGPRSCPGMRLAMITQKLVWVHILNNFKLVKGDKFEDQWQFDPNIAGGIGFNSIFSKLEKRV